MIKQEYIDLMNQEFDRTNTPEQSQKLEEYLSGHSEARSYYRELAQALGVFENVDMLNPPPGLRESIDHSKLSRLEYGLSRLTAEADVDNY